MAEDPSSGSYVVLCGKLLELLLKAEGGGSLGVGDGASLGGAGADREGSSKVTVGAGSSLGRG